MIAPPESNNENAARLAESEAQPREPLGQWLIENMPRGADLEVPGSGRSSRREIPFTGWDDDDCGAKSDR